MPRFLASFLTSMVLRRSDYRRRLCYETLAAELIMMADSMSIDTTDLFVEAGLVGFDMRCSTTDTADLDSTELEH